MTATQPAPLLPLYHRYQNARDASGVRIQGHCVICNELHPGLFRTAYGMVCTHCYRTELKPVLCAQCARRTVRAKLNDPEPHCAVCRHRLMVASCACVACRTPLQTVEQWTDDGPICAKCYQGRRPPRKCGYCNRYRRSVCMHSKYGDGRPICHVCIYSRLPKCRGCKRRFRRGNIEAELCLDCASGRCPKVHCACGAWTRQFGHLPARCVNCALKADVVPKTRDRLLRGLQQEWVKRLFIDYCKTLCERFRWANSIPEILRTDFDIFSEIDQSFAAQEGLTECNLASTLGPKLFTRRTRVLRWLVQRSIIGPLCPKDRGWAILTWKLQALLKATEGPWIIETVQAFHANLIAEREHYVRKHHERVRAPLQARSAYQNLRAARDFLRSAEARGVNELSAVSQWHLDYFVASQAHPPSELGRFIRFLNGKTIRFDQLQLLIARRNNSMAPALSPSEFDDLLIAMLQPQSRRDLRYMLMTLFCLLFAQFPKTVVQIRSDALRVTDGHWQFRPAKVWLDIPEAMAALLVHWQSGRRMQSAIERTESSPYLFPGLRASEWTSVTTLNYWLKCRGIRPGQLFVSGFANLCHYGLRFASTARDAYGINSATACKYLAAFHPNKVASVAAAVKESRRRRRTKSKGRTAP